MFSNLILLGWIQLGRYFGAKKAVLEKEEEDQSDDASYLFNVYRSHM